MFKKFNTKQIETLKNSKGIKNSNNNIKKILSKSIKDLELNHRTDKVKMIYDFLTDKDFNGLFKVVKLSDKFLSVNHKGLFLYDKKSNVTAFKSYNTQFNSEYLAIRLSNDNLPIVYAIVPLAYLDSFKKLSEYSKARWYKLNQKEKSIVKNWNYIKSKKLSITEKELIEELDILELDLIKSYYNNIDITLSMLLDNDISNMEFLINLISSEKELIEENQDKQEQQANFNQMENSKTLLDDYNIYEEKHLYMNYKDMKTEEEQFLKELIK